MSKQVLLQNSKISESTTATELSHSVTALHKAMLELIDKQSTLMEKLDSFVMKVMAHEERLKRLEDNLLNHLENATWIKATIRFWPLLVAALLLGHEVH
jgi:hypothetical protein